MGHMLRTRDRRAVLPLSDITGDLTNLLLKLVIQIAHQDFRETYSFLGKPDQMWALGLRHATLILGGP